MARLRHHESVANAALERIEDDGGFTVVVHMNVNLPSRAKARGKTASGIKAQERAVLTFGADWPDKAPRIHLRASFPSSSAHVLSHRKGDPVPPCIMEAGNVDELLHSRGLDGLIDQLAIWLQHAAAGTLANPGDGWEPMRRERFDAAMCFEAQAVIDSMSPDGSVRSVRANYLSTDDWPVIFVESKSGAPGFSQSAIGTDGFAGETAVFLARAPFTNGIATVFDTYQADTVVSLDDLLEVARSVGVDAESLRVALHDFFQNSKHACSKDPSVEWPRGFLVGVVLGVERPVPLVGSTRQTTELLTYLLRVPPTAFAVSLQGNAEVSAVSHVQPASASLLARLAGYEGAPLDKKIVVLGVGSLGSKVSAHLARAGFGNQTLVDKGNMAFHNPARHALFEAHGSKAEKMKTALAAIGHAGVIAHTTDARAVLSASPTEFAKTVPADTTLLLDTTGSAAVLDAMVLSTALSESRVRVATASFYSHGRAAVLSLESPQRTVRVDDLEAALFAEARKNERLLQALQRPDAGLTATFIGQNCQSLTMQMPDSTVSRGAAAVAMQVERWLATNVPAEAVLCVGVEEPDGIGMSWRVVTVPPTVVCRDSGWDVRVLGEVARRMEADAHQWQPSETGGALLGSISYETRTIIIGDLVDAPPDSVRSPTLFQLGTQGLKEEVRRASVESVGYLSFVGTWHSHPQGGSHSTTDHKTLRKLALQARGAPSVSLVWTPTGFLVKVEEA